VTAPHDRPTAAELLEAVREFLEEDVASEVEGRTRFHLRVAVNVLSMLEREERLGPSQEAAHQDRLAVLGVETDAELAAGIRDGSLHGRLAEVATCVRSSVVDKLLVANPDYLDES
jgi:hypothetical protein